jgi:hypothetical protein
VLLLWGGCIGCLWLLLLLFVLGRTCRCFFAKSTAAL